MIIYEPWKNQKALCWVRKDSISRVYFGYMWSAVHSYEYEVFIYQQILSGEKKIYKKILSNGEGTDLERES